MQKNSNNQSPAIATKQKRKWFATWWGILLIIFVFIPMGFTVFTMTLAIETTNQNYEQNNTPEKVAEQTKQDSEKQTADRQHVIDTYAPVYCANQQKILVNEPALLAQGWPNADGKHGVTNEECIVIITKLYDYLDGYAQRGDRIEQIANRKMWVGMERLELIYSQGSPQDVNRTTTASGTREQWVYGSPINGTGGYAYLDGDVVTSIQN